MSNFILFVDENILNKNTYNFRFNLDLLLQFDKNEKMI